MARQRGTAAEAEDRRLAKACLEKRGRKEKTTREERAALRRIENAREEESQWRHYGAIPKKHYVEMSGRQHKVLLDQAARWGLPLRGRTVDIAAVLRAFHDLLAGKLAAVDDGGPVPWIEQYREERTRLARLERRLREGVLLDREQVHEGLGRIAGILRGAGDLLQKQFGPDALEIMNEALDDAQREIDRLCGDAADGHHPDEQPDP